MAKEENATGAFENYDIQTAITTIDRLIEAGCFTSEAISEVRSAALTLTLIHLDDLLQHAAKRGNRFSEPAGMVVGGKESADVTDAISFSRNAVCHPRSPKHIAMGNKIGGAFYNCGGMIVGGQVIQLPPNEDGFIFGGMMLLMNGHILAALAAMKAIYREAEVRFRTTRGDIWPHVMFTGTLNEALGFVSRFNEHGRKTRIIITGGVVLEPDEIARRILQMSEA